MAEDEKFTINAINHEFDKMNSELWKRNKSGNVFNMNNLDNLDNKRMSSKQSIVDLLTSLGISKKEVLEAMDSLALEMQIKSNEEKTIKNRILAMPTFIFDGKYRTDPSIAGGFDQYWHVVNYIIDVVNQENKSGKV